jgi:tellurite methyltransferase
MTDTLQDQFGNIDIYLFDQLLKGRIDVTKRILDAGCGGGRNLIYFLKQGYDVHAVDQNPNAVGQAKQLAAQLAPDLPSSNFQRSQIEELPYPDQTFDVVISNAVLHFCRDKQQFEEMLFAMWRVLKDGGFLFVRVSSMVGIETGITALGNGHYRNPDGSKGYLVGHKMLLDYTAQLKGQLIEDIKTTNVQGFRCMTTWCVGKQVS